MYCITSQPRLALHEATGACNTLSFAPGGGTKACAAPDLTRGHDRARWLHCTALAVCCDVKAARQSPIYGMAGKTSSCTAMLF